MKILSQTNCLRLFINRYKLYTFLCIAGVMLVIYILSLPCPILYITGIPCPGCGMTRALEHLARLSFVEAFYYHPLSFFLPFFLLVFFLQKHIPSKVYTVCIWTIIGIFFFTYLLRLFNSADVIVKINISKGFIYRLLHGFQ